MSNSAPIILNNRSKFTQLLPYDCLLCGTRSNSRLCAGCAGQLPRHGAACPVCALPVPDGSTCGQCLKRPPAFDRTLTAFSYAFPADALIRSLKYDHNLAVAPVLAEPLAEVVRVAPRPDLLIPLPLHRDRVRERGFNQSLELARLLSASLDLPLALDAVERTRATVPQASLPLKERAKNLRGAFASRRDLTGKRIAVLDDVMTSGASMNELSLALRRAGAVEISAWVVARA